MKFRKLFLAAVIFFLTGCRTPGLQYAVEHNPSGSFTVINGSDYQTLASRKINFLLLLSHEDCSQCQQEKPLLLTYIKEVNPVKIYLLELNSEEDHDSEIISAVEEVSALTGFELLNEDKGEFLYGTPTIFLFLEGFMAGYQPGYRNGDTVSFIKEYIKSEAPDIT